MNNDKGYTLLELLIVLAILALIAGIAVPQVMSIFSRAKRDTAKIQIDSLASDLEFYKLDTGRYPDEKVGLTALIEAPENVENWNGPYIPRSTGLNDPWGTPYKYNYARSKNRVQIFSLGADGQEGGEGDNADIRN